MSSKQKLLLLLASAVIILFILVPYLFSGKVIRGDGGDFAIPYFAFLEDFFKNGASPFWNPQSGLGFPTFVSNVNPFFPLNFFLLVFSPVVTHQLGLFLALTLALFFTTLFIHELGISPIAALIGGLGFLISQTTYESSAITSFAIFFQALFFWGLVKFIKSDSSRKRLGYGALLSLAVAIAWLCGGGNYQLTTYTIIGGFALALFLAWKNKQNLWGLSLIHI